jgi:DNA-binding HxlR family transcriptional regulator
MSETNEAVREVLSRLGDRWSLEALAALREGPRRFTALQRALEGVSKRMLSLTVRGLERDGLVSRTALPGAPPRVDYALTPLGLALLEPALALARWAQAHQREMDDARRRFDQSARA